MNNEVAETANMITVTGNMTAESPVSATKNGVIKRKERKRKEYLLHHSLLARKEKMAEEEPETTRKKKRELTQEDIDGIKASADGQSGNLPGLLDNLRLYHIPPVEQHAIVLNINYI